MSRSAQDEQVARSEQVDRYKQVARATWARGDYDAMMRREGLYEVGERLVRRVGVGPGQDVLDIACGTGNASIPAARAGGRVTALDLTPEMLAVGWRRAAAAGVDVEWVEGDAESLPVPDRRFDVVLSTFGCMFAPRHDVVADEIARVLRPGGRLGLCTWLPEGPIGDFFRTVGGHLPPLPDVADPPLAWGDEGHVQEMFEGAGISLEFHRETSVIRYASVDDAVDCYATTFGPVVTARVLLEAQGRWPDLRRDMVTLFGRHRAPGGTRVALPADHLVVLGRRTG